MRDTLEQVAKRNPIEPHRHSLSYQDRNAAAVSRAIIELDFEKTYTYTRAEVARERVGTTASFISTRTSILCEWNRQ